MLEFILDAILYLERSTADRVPVVSIVLYCDPGSGTPCLLSQNFRKEYTA